MRPDLQFELKIELAIINNRNKCYTHKYKKILNYPLNLKFIYEKGEGNRSTNKNKSGLMVRVKIYIN